MPSGAEIESMIRQPIAAARVSSATFEQDDELVTAEPGDHISVAAGRDEALGDLDQHRVADLVAVTIVDPL